MIRILIVAGHMNVGGIENQLMHLLRKADKDCFHIDFTTTVDNPFYEEEIKSLGSDCIHLPPTQGIHFLRYCKSLYKVMKAGQYDIVHSHELFHSGMVLLTARLAGVKHRFVHAHNWMEGNNPKAKKSLKRKVYNKVMQKLIQWNATEFIACSTWAGRFLYGDKVLKQSNYHLVYNSVDTSKFIEKFNQKESGEFCNDDYINVIQVGRFTPVKNQLFTVELARELKNRGKKIRFLCVGNTGDDYEVQVKSRIKEYSLENEVLLLGVRKDIDVLMRKASAFILPSLYEGMPLVLIEAQASGLPCVVADTFSREVDFNIGSINWLQLEDGVSVWCDAIEEAVHHERYDLDSIKKAIDKYGFDSQAFADSICDLYESAC